MQTQLIERNGTLEVLKTKQKPNILTIRYDIHAQMCIKVSKLLFSHHVQALCLHSKIINSHKYNTFISKAHEAMLQHNTQQ